MCELQFEAMKQNVNLEVEEGVEEYENAVEKTGFGMYNMMLLLLGGASMMTLIVETMSMAYILPAAQCDLKLSVSDRSIISSISFLGIVFSSLLWGFLADLYGRRKVMVLSLSISCLFGFISSICPYVWLFIICRFINGFFIGCPASVAIAYIGEFHSDKYRGKVISWTGAFVAIGSLYSPGLSWAILPMQWEFYLPGLGIMMKPWRLLIILFSFPSLIIAFMFLKFPESPKFLWSVGRSEECLSILRNMYSTNTGKPKSMFPVTQFEVNKIPEKIVDTSQKSGWQIAKSMWKILLDQTVPLFKKPLLKNTLLTSFIQLGIQSGAQGVFMWVPEIFNRVAYYVGQFPGESVTICTAFEYQNETLSTNFTEVLDMVVVDMEDSCSDTVDEDVFMIITIFSCVYTFVFILIGFIINIFGKKLLLILVIIITSSGGVLLNSMQSMSTIVLCLGMYLMMGPCMNIVFCIQVELFPTQHRAKSVAITQVFGRIGAVCGSSLVGFLLGWQCLSVFYIFSGVYIGLIFLSLMLPIPLFIKKTPPLQ